VRGWWKYVRIAVILLVSLVQVVGMVMFWNRTMAREIRRRKKIEGRLRESEGKKSKMIDELDQLNRQKNEYIGIVAHDLRNPICAIELMASFLLENNRSKLDADQREFATRIEKLSHFMEMLIEDILDYSKIEAGRIELQKVRTDYNSLVLDNLRINSLIAEQKGINITSDLEPGLSNIELDQKKIEQVLHNLLSNAVKYSGRDSGITVTTRKDKGGVMTVVRDQGQGIPEEELHRLFQPFQRTSVRSTSGEASTGLGLAIVKRIVEAHGGSIGVRSRVGEGSEFYFYLPG
jgi:signal transduction histidine kinase